MTVSQTSPVSPFHRGERQAQERKGARQKVERIENRVIRDHMPDQHREFYASLPFVLIGSLDTQSRPWASLLPGRPGFLSTPDERTLEVHANPLFGDPLHDTLQPGAELGLLGIELETRRRNRVNGVVTSRSMDGIRVAVRQSFGNCPQYIQSRGTALTDAIDDPNRAKPIHRSDRIDGRARAIIAESDTLFIATSWLDDAGSPGRGVDISHRGGKPGFVRVEGDAGLVFPDFAGNNFFNTVGNLALNPGAGLLFADFDKGDLVYLTGTAEVLWDGAEVDSFAGAERLIRFRAEEVICVDSSLPFRFEFRGYSPTLQTIGNWNTKPSP